MRSFMTSGGCRPFRLLCNAIGIGILTITAGCDTGNRQALTGGLVTNLMPSLPVTTSFQGSAKKSDDVAEVVSTCPTGVEMDIQKTIGPEHWLIVSCPSPGVWSVQRTFGGSTLINDFAIDGMYISSPYVDRGKLGAEIDAFIKNPEEQKITTYPQWVPPCKCTSWEITTIETKTQEKELFLSNNGSSYSVMKISSHQRGITGKYFDYDYKLAGPITLSMPDGKHVFFLPVSSQHVDGVDYQLAFKTLDFILPK